MAVVVKKIAAVMCIAFVATLVACMPVLAIMGSHK